MKERKSPEAKKRIRRQKIIEMLRKGGRQTNMFDSGGHFNHPAVRNGTSVTVRQHNSLSKY